MKVFYLLFALLCVVEGGTVRSVVGEDVKFPGSPGARKWFLLISRDDGGKFDEIGTSNNSCNCSRFRDRVIFSGDTFTLKNAQEIDTGRFKVRSRFGKNNSTTLEYDVVVAKFRPVLVPVTLSQHSIGLFCVDHGNPWGLTETVIYGMSYYKNHPSDAPMSSGIKKWGRGGAVVTQKVEHKYAAFRAACCSMKEKGGKRHCGPAAYIQLRGDICEWKVPGWDWCKGWRGPKAKYPLKGPWNDASHLYSMHETKNICKKHTSAANTSACMGSYMVLDSTQKALWRRKQEPCFESHPRKLSNTSSSFYEVRDISPRTGVGFYRAYFNETGAWKDFKVQSAPVLGVELEIVRLEQADLKLRCKYRSSEKVKVTWTVGGIYAWYKAEGDNLHLRLDCGYNHRYWRFEGHVFCSAESATWKGESSTFSFYAYRTALFCTASGGGGFGEMW